MRGWRCFTAAGLNRSLVTARWSRCDLPSRCTSVAGAGMPLASISSQSESRPSTEREVLSQWVLSRLTANTSAWRVRAQNSVKSGSATWSTGSVARIRATSACHRSMSAQRSGWWKRAPRESVAVSVMVVNLPDVVGGQPPSQVRMSGRRTVADP